MNFLTRFAMKNAALIFLSILLVVIGGIYSAKQLKTEALPDIDVPIIWMSIVYPGAGPNDVSKEITEPVEKSMQEVSGIKTVTSYAKQNVGIVVMEFDMDADLDKAQQEINFALQKVTLPDNVIKPEIHRANVNNSDIISFSISGKKDQVAIKQFVEEKIKPSLSTIEGVESINISGSGEKKFYIKLKADKIKEYQLNPETINQAIKFSNLSIPAGEVTIGDKLMPIEVKKEVKSIDQLKKIRIITLDTGKGLKTSFTSVQEGFEQIGKALTGMGQGLIGIGQLQGAIQGEIDLVNKLTEHQAKLSQAQRDLNLLLVSPNPDPEKITQLQGSVYAETEYIKGIQSGLNQMVNAINKSTSQISKTKTSTSKKKTNKSVDMTPGIKIVELKDIADISFGNSKEETISRTNGKPSVVFGVARQSGGNVVEIVKNVKDKLKEISLPEGYAIEELYNNADPIKASIKSMVKEGILGAIFAVIITLIFLRNIRATIVAIISIPLSILAALIALKWFNYTINIMTLSGMAVAVGRVVDDSIVVIENIYRRIRESEEATPKLIYSATKEVSGAITSSTLTTIAVFGPLALVSGVIGKIFVSFAITVVIALLFSLLVAITVVPLAGRLLLLKLQPVEEKEGSIVKTYSKIIKWSLNHKLIVIGSSLLLLIASLTLVKSIGTNFLPQDKVRYYMAAITMPVGSSTEKTFQITESMEKILKGTSGVWLYQSTTNSDGSANIFISLKPEIENPDQVINKLRKEFKNIHNVKDISLQSLEGPAGNAMMEIIVNGPDGNSIKAAGKQITQVLQKESGMANISSNIEDIKPQIKVEINEEKAAAKGLSPIMIAGTLRGIISGDKVGTLDYQGKSVDINLSYKIDNIKDLKNIQNLELMSMTGEKVLLKEVAKVYESPGPTTVQRRNQTDFVTINALITDANSGQVSEKVSAELKSLKLPKGVTYSMEGNTKMMQDGFREMGIAMIVAVFLVFLVMIGAFGSAQVPFAILFSLPLAIIGVLVGLYISGEQLGMPALIGGLMLIGIVVTNAIVLMDRAVKQIDSGMPVETALIEAGKTRLRPIFMTAIATIFALIPLAVTPAEGALISKSMAVVVIGGLITSTLLTLIVVPVVYLVLERIKVKIFGTKSAKSLILEG